MDRLSALPDDLLHQILSTLGLKQVVATSILSRRWKHVWASAKNFKIHTTRCGQCPLPDSLFHLQSLKILHFDSLYCEPLSWPASATLPSLEDLFFCGVEFKDHTGRGTAISSSCPRLKIWKMKHCRGLDRLDVQLLDLEEFSMENCYELEEVVLSTPELKRFTMYWSFYGRFSRRKERKSAAISASNLESFTWIDQPVNEFSMTSGVSPVCSRIELLFRSRAEVTSVGVKNLMHCLSGTRDLAIDAVSTAALKSQEYQHLEVLRLLVPFNMKRDVSCIFRALKRFPNLRTLEITNVTYNKGYMKLKHAVEGGGLSETHGLSLDRLTEINFMKFKATAEEVDVIEVLLKTSGSLEKVMIAASKSIPINRFPDFYGPTTSLSEVFAKLEKLPSASSNLRFLFKQT